MYKLKEVNNMLKIEDLPQISRQMLSRLRGMTITVKSQNGKKYDVKPKLLPTIHYQEIDCGRIKRFMITDEGFKVIREWAIERRAKNQAKAKDSELSSWVQANAKRLIKEYSNKNGKIDFDEIEKAELNRNFPNVPKVKFNEIVRQAVGFNASE